jgi:type II secretory pathway pseudopilin PulG
VRVLIGLAVMGVAATVLLGAWLLDRRDGRRQGVTDSELRQLAQQMARQLDLALADPMLRQSSGWEERVRVLLDRFYGRELR